MYPVFARIVLIVAFALLPMNGCAAKTVTDMAGHVVDLPDKVTRIVTLGAVPVINGFLFAFGKQESIANGLPPNLTRKFQFVFAPGLADKPIVQGAENGLAVEQIIALKPDLVLTLDEKTAQTLYKLGLPALQLHWSASDDAKKVMALLGEVFGEPEVAQDYARYFDQTLADVAGTLERSGATERPRVLYVNFRRLTQPHRIAEWWIAQAGGRSVTDNGRAQESLTFSVEQMIAWDPQIIIVGERAEVELILNDPKLQNVSAVRDHRVFVAPAGAHLWANRTVEQPLTVLWAASVFRPDLFSQDRLRAEMTGFYDRFFHVHLTPSQIDEILLGSSGH